MTDLVLAYVGEKDGQPIFSAMNASDEKAIGSRKVLVCKLVGKKGTITFLQNRALRLYFSRVSQALNDAGLDMKIVLERLSKRFLIPWSPEAVLERLWRPVQKHTYGTDSTTELETDQVTVVYEALNEVTSSQFGIGIPFPDEYSQMYEQMGESDK